MSGRTVRQSLERRESEQERRMRYATERSNESISETIKELADKHDLKGLEDLIFSKKLDLDFVEIDDWYACLYNLFYKATDTSNKFIDKLLKPSKPRRLHLLLLKTFNSWKPLAKDASYIRPIMIAERLIGVSPALCCSIGEYDGKKMDHPSVYGAARVGMVDVLQKMLKHCRESEKLGLVLNERIDNNTPLNIAVRQGHFECVKMLLYFDPAIETRKAELITAVTYSKDEIFEMMINKCHSLVRDSPEVLEAIIKKGASQALESTMEKHSDLLVKSTFLHTAVEHKQVEMVAKMVKMRPELVVARDHAKKKYPIFYNKFPDIRSLHQSVHQPRDGALEVTEREQFELEREIEPRKKIRDILLPEMVMRINAGALQEAFAEANNQLDEVILNLSFFDPKTHDFGKFLSLIELETKKKAPLAYNIAFEKHLRFVKFPDFDLLRHQGPRTRFDSSPITENEVSKIWRWLEVVHKVEKIYEIIVPDSLETPHSEEFIEDCLSRWHVKVLNWRRTDLSIDSIRIATTPQPADGVQDKKSESTLRELYLYSSGNQAAIAHWLSPQGIQSMKLDKVHVIICKDLVSMTRGMLLKKRMEDDLNELARELNGPDKKKPNREPKFVPRVLLEDWRTKESSKRSQSWNTEPAHIPYTLNRLQEFLEFYKVFRHQHKEDLSLHTKVALIDFGVDGQSMSNSRVSHGRSLVHEEGGNRETNWWLATDEHGTQMAQIIQQIDSFCNLHPIKIANSNAGLNTAKMIQGIEAAIEKRVDIICISLALGLKHEDLNLKAVVEKAVKERILLFCTAADVRDDIPDPYPAEYAYSLASVMSIAEHKSGVVKRSYEFQGTEFGVQDIQYMKNLPSNVSGSSVATAVAVGVASLILTCSRFANGEPKDLFATIKAKFKKMTTDGEPDFVQPWQFFPSDRLSLNEGEKWIQDEF